MTIKVYYDRISIPSRTVLMVVKQLGIDLNLKRINLLQNEHLSPDFIKINPTHKVPVIVDNGFVLWESRAIAQYLCNKYAPDSDLYPQDPKRRALVDRVLNFDIGTYFPAIGESLITKVFVGVEPTEEKLNALKNLLKLLDQFIGDNKYVAGDQLSIADLSILSAATLLIIDNYDLKDYPKLNEWLTRLRHELPYFEDIHGEIIEDAPNIAILIQKWLNTKK